MCVLRHNTMEALSVYDLGLLEYQKAFELQEELLHQRVGGKRTDILLLVEHPPTLTMGRRDDQKNLHISETGLKEMGVSLFHTDRGGSITWHGPGQLVAYPIVDLRSRGMDIHKYIQDLEEVIIRTLNDFTIKSGRDDKHIGVWVGQDKIAAIGVRIKKWVTKHGLAINVNSDLAHFSLINPCGITDRGVTAMADILGREVPMESVRKALIDRFVEVFQASLVLEPEPLK